MRLKLACLITLFLCASFLTLPVRAAEVNVRVSGSDGDAEELVSDGYMSRGSPDLELIHDASFGDQKVGIRFQNIQIPQGYKTTQAYIEFSANETDNVNPCDLTIYGEAIDDAPYFSSTYYDISSRTKTSASVSWSPEDWTTVHATYQTTELKTIVQEIVNRAGWTAGNDMVFIIEGTGRRVAESYDGDPSKAPLLYIEFEAPLTHYINATADSGGTISPPGNVIVVDGQNKSFTITPDAGNSITDVTVDGASQGIITSYTFTNVTDDHTIHASFYIPIPNPTYTITATAGNGGTISPSGTVTVVEGNNQTFTITPDTGNSITDVVVDGGSQGVIDSYTFTNVTDDHTIHASFYIAPLLTIQKAGAGSGAVTSAPAGIDCGGTCSADFADGLEVTLTATPDPGSAFDDFSGGGCLGNGACSILFDQDYTITATFNLDGDGDGISDLREDGGPNGGDANQDGTLDSFEADVATFPGITGSYVTLISEAGTALTNVTATVNPSCADAPAECTYPQGFFGFTVTRLTPGAETTVRVILYEKDTTINTYYKYGPTLDNYANHWYLFSSDGQTGATITQEATQITIPLSFIDGQRGDDDLAANGEITNVGAPTKLTGGDNGGGCFIATAAFGSPMQPYIKILREFRDRFLLTNRAGRAFTDAYYTLAPPIADSIARHESLRGLVRWGLLPVVGISWVILRLGPLAIMVLVICFFMGLMGITRLRRRKRV